MSSTHSLQSHRPTPPISPPVDIKDSPNMNSHLPNTPQSPPLASSVASHLNVSSTISASNMSNTSMQLAATAGPTMNPAEASMKRKREIQDDGDQEQKKVHIESGTPGIEALHRDVGPPYRLASTPYPKAQVDLTVDLFKVFSLEKVASEVARGGPNPMKMGKTYKKHMRTMGLSGKFDAVKKRDDEPGLFDMLHLPDEEWSHQQTLGKNLQNGLTSHTRLNLAQAMSMSKGRIPKDIFDPSVLALGDNAPSVAATGKPASTVGLHKKVPGQGTTATTAPAVRKTAVEQPRPQRNIKKRTYTDDGFEGYGEGYADDHMADDSAFRPGDEIGEKRRKKESSTYRFPPTSMRHSSYGPGTVGA